MRDDLRATPAAYAFTAGIAKAIRQSLEMPFEYVHGEKLGDVGWQTAGEIVVLEVV